MILTKHLAALCLAGMVAWGACGIHAANAQQSDADTSPTQTRAGRRGGEGARGAARGDAATSGTAQAQRPRRDLFAARLNNAESFSNRGIETYSHQTLVSRKFNFNGQHETEVGFTVYLPPDYDSSEDRYPVIYFLHGLGGNENNSFTVVQKADELIKAGELPPFILVFANGAQSFYGNHFEGKFQFYDYFVEELIPHIDETYRTMADRKHRHMQGFSMGGYGAMMFAVKRPDLFGGVTDMGGALLGPRFNVWPEMYNESEENYRPFDIFLLAEDNREALKDSAIAIWIGSADSTRGSNEQFRDRLTELGIDHQYNDMNSRPLLEGVPHNLPRYFELYGKEILQFHTDAFAE